MIVMVFEFNIEPEQYEAYLSVAADLRSHLAQIEGFISIERFESHATPGRFVSVGYFENEEAVVRWRNLPEHRQAQALGRSRLFTSYRLVMAEALRDYTGDRRDTAPQDSRQSHGS